MKKNIYKFVNLLVISLLCYSQDVMAQRTQFRGFVDALTYFQDNKVSFSFGEQDLFITSELNERLSFLGETVVKYSPESPTLFNVSIERVIMKYNYAGNHNLLIGKHHTPVNYWNDTYHHGRVFFPTIERPLIFSEGIIPLHTTGVSLQGQNLGDFRFGYDLMVGNGLGSSDLLDNNNYKSITAAVHIKPKDGLRIGASYYRDVISKSSLVHNHTSGTSVLVNSTINQQLFTGSLAYFGSKYELLVESTMALNKSDSLGVQNTMATYAYAGIRVAEKVVPYVRFDDIQYKNGEVYFSSNNMQSYVGGVRYEINYLAVLKLEYQHTANQMKPIGDKVTFQIAIGF